MAFGDFIKGLSTQIAMLLAGTQEDGTALPGLPVTTPAKVRVEATKTRPTGADAYTAKDAISESTSAGTVWTFTGALRKAAGTGYIVSAKILTSQTTCTETFRLHLFNAAPTALNDNAACTAPLYADDAKYIGPVEFPACKTEGSGATAAYAVATPNTLLSNLPLPIVGGATANLFGILETPTGFTPASEQTISITLVVEQD
jgi:hypothetical protein